jgi:tRNA threonylcarbamoyladenosine modification (KEOPS) complex  Pcc1 subunit
VFDGTEFFVEGEAGGTGTDGDFVEIRYFTGRPTNVNADDQQGRVRQSEFSTLEFAIDSEVPERDLDLSIVPEKCSVDGKINDPKAKGSVTVSCSGDDIFAEISASQLASLQAAFSSTRNVKIKVKSDGSKGSLRITLKGSAGEPG